MRKLLFAFVATLFSFSAMAGGHAEWWKNAGAPYAGTTLQGIAENTPPGQFAGDVLAKEFEALTGIKVRLENTSWDQMYDKAIKDMEKKIKDQKKKSEVFETKFKDHCKKQMGKARDMYVRRRKTNGKP